MERPSVLSRCCGSLFLAALLANAALAQSAPPAPAPSVSDPSALAAAPIQPGTPAASGAVAPPKRDAHQAPDASKAQPTRILGVMPNYRAVSAGALPPPPTPFEALKIATQNSFDYSSFVFTGLTTLEAEVSGAHPALGTGISGYGKYYWRGFVDKVDGNYLVIFALPTVFHQDERYYAMGEGGFWKRLVYSASRTVITPDYHGHPSFNASEVFGRGMAQAVSAAYYPPGNRSLGDLAVKYGWAVGRDTGINVFREFWPDLATHVLHRHP